jgi:hypothetical protein
MRNIMFEETFGTPGSLIILRIHHQELVNDPNLVRNRLKDNFKPLNQADLSLHPQEVNLTANRHGRALTDHIPQATQSSIKIN